MLDKFKDECGVFGIFGHPEAANLTYLGLYALQHRGQESAGIATADGEKMRISRAMGHVADAFDERALEALPGHIAIGHTRYSTAGESRLLNAQPILIDCAHGQIAIAHNGNLVNASELRDRLVRDGSIFQTSSDTEVVLHLYARSREHTVEDALIESISQVRGAFSLVLLTKDRLIAARDPHGFRPLALGQLDDAYIVCSETCALDLIGATYVRDIEPGEVLIISDGGAALAAPVSAGAARALHLRARLLRAARQLRLRPERQRGAHRARPHPRARSRRVDADVVVPIPDSGVCAATGFAEASGIPMADGADPQSLRRPHVHPAAAGDPPLQRAHQAEPGAQHPRGPARHPRRRLDRARHDQPEDREDGARRRRAGSAHADHLSADDLAVLLRRRHAEPLGADRRDAHARADPRLHRGRHASPISVSTGCCAR